MSLAAVQHRRALNVGHEPRGSATHMDTERRSRTSEPQLVNHMWGCDRLKAQIWQCHAARDARPTATLLSAETRTLCREARLMSDACEARLMSDAFTERTPRARNRRDRPERPPYRTTSYGGRKCYTCCRTQSAIRWEAMRRSTYSMYEEPAHWHHGGHSAQPRAMNKPTRRHDVDVQRKTRAKNNRHTHNQCDVPSACVKWNLARELM